MCWSALSDISVFYTLTQIIQTLAHVSITWLVVTIVQLLSCVQLFAIVRAHPMDRSTPGSSVFHCLLKFAQIYIH